MAGLDVVIPAGGKLDAEFEKLIGVKSKALIPIYHGKTILETTIEALRAAPSVNRIVVVGSQEVLDHSVSKLADQALLATGSSPDNIMVGLRAISNMESPQEKVLISTCDLPFLTADIIEEFISLCSGESDFYVPLINKNDFEERFPSAEATFVKLMDGEWTTGCLYIATVKGVLTARPHLERVFQNRKSKFKMASMLGFRFVWNYLMQRLTVPDVEKKIRELLGVKGVAVSGAPPELAFDIDYIEDYHYLTGQVCTQTKTADSAKVEEQV
jgi:molybdopterin-guanine dinucleotide biosynthesis protein A